MTDDQFARIARALAQPRRFRILQEIGASEDPTPYATLRKTRRMAATTLFRDTKELETVGLIHIVREGELASIVLQRHVLRAFQDRLSF